MRVLTINLLIDRDCLLTKDYEKTEQDTQTNSVCQMPENFFSPIVEIIQEMA